MAVKSCGEYEQHPEYLAFLSCPLLKCVHRHSFINLSLYQSYIDYQVLKHNLVLFGGD